MTSKILKSSSSSPLFLFLLLLAWGISSSLCDTFNKAVLQEFQYPITITLMIFGVSSLCGAILFHILKLQTYQSPNQRIGFSKFRIVTLCQMLGFLLTYGSYGRTDVSFSQTIKASAPLFSLAISMIFFNQRFSLPVYLSLLPIILGVIVTSATEMSFDLYGMLMAFGSNICFTSRSIFGKPFFKLVDSANLYHYMCVTAFITLLPIWLITDGLLFYNNPLLLMQLVGQLKTIIIASILHWVYNQISVWVLSLVAPLTHAVCNVLRRILVITVTIIYFGRTPSKQNVLGIATVFIGVAWYLKARNSMDQQQKFKNNSKIN